MCRRCRSLIAFTLLLLPHSAYVVRTTPFAPYLQDILDGSLFYLTHDRRRNLIPAVSTVTSSTLLAHGILTPSLNAAAAAVITHEKRSQQVIAPEGF